MRSPLSIKKPLETTSPHLKPLKQLNGLTLEQSSDLQFRGERRPLFGTAGWWGDKRTLLTNSHFDGGEGFQKMFFIAGKS